MAVSKHGRTLLEYKKVSVHDSPFETNGVKADVDYQIYKIKVMPNGKTEIAWYQTVNAIMGVYSGEWIWEP